MDYLWVTVKTIGAVVGMTLLIPLMVWGGTGNWRRALGALREYWLIMGTAVTVVGGLALLVLLLEFIDSAPH